jgi:hypothetical protein
VLPIYQLIVEYIGSKGSAQDMVIAVHVPVYDGTPVNTLSR